MTLAWSGLSDVLEPHLCACDYHIAGNFRGAKIFADWTKMRFSRVKFLQMASLLILYSDFQKFRRLNFCGCSQFAKTAKILSHKNYPLYGITKLVLPHYVLHILLCFPSQWFPIESEIKHAVLLNRLACAPAKKFSANIVAFRFWKAKRKKGSRSQWWITLTTITTTETTPEVPPSLTESNKPAACIFLWTRLIYWGASITQVVFQTKCPRDCWLRYSYVVLVKHKVFPIMKQQCEDHSPVVSNVLLNAPHLLPRCSSLLK